MIDGTQSRRNDAESVETCVRTFLDGFLSGRDDSYLQFATPQLAFFDNLGNAAKTTSGGAILQRSYGIERLRVQRITGDLAEVDVHAWLRYVGQMPTGGTGEFSSKITGPAILRRTGEDWRVADFIMDGFAFVRNGYIVSSKTLEVGGLHLDPVALKRRDDSIVLFVNVRNSERVESVLTSIKARRRFLWLIPWQKYEAFLSSTVFAPGECAVCAVAFDPRLPIRRHMSLEVSAHAQLGSVCEVMELYLEQAQLDGTA